MPDKLPFRPPADLPTQSGPRGIRFDFNDGCRVWLPEADGSYRVRLSDIDNGNVLFETEIRSGRINSTKRYFEFATPHRVVNYHACNSCWNDPDHRFDHKDFLWCPRHKDTPRQFECTRLITFEQVRRTVENIPGFEMRNRNRTQ